MAWHLRSALLAIALLLAASPATAWAHAGLVQSDPVAGAALGASPTAVRLTFSERPEPSLSTVRVMGAQAAPVRRAAGDPLSLVVPISRLGRGVYTVDWRIVSAVDGHASFGKYAFGVGVTPPKGATTSRPATSKLELLARWILLTGLVLLVGSAVAGIARFGGSAGTDLLLATGGALVAVIGLLLLAEAQRRTAESSLSSLLDSPVGGALIGRGVAIAAAGVALLLARTVARFRALALAAAAVAATVAIVVHVAAGHAGAGSWPEALTVLAQSTHFVAAGVWFGGLAALLAGLAPAQPAARQAAVHRFSIVAVAALIAILVTGTVRAIDELTSFGDLFSSGYGRAVLAKIVLVGLIAAVAARNRRRNVPVAGTDPKPLRRTSRAELALAAVALATAALLGTLSPPVSGKAATPPGLSASGAGVKLTTASAEPGPNTFTVRVQGAGGGRVSLRFDPLDDPGVRPTTLALTPSGSGSYTGSGPNLRFEGRWRVTVRAGNRVVPLELDVPGPDQPVSVLRVPGQPPEYTMQISNFGYIRLKPDPERAGPSTVTIDVFNAIQSEESVRQFVVTTAAGDGPARQVATRRQAPNRFTAAVSFTRGRNTITVVTRTRDGRRLRGAFDLDVR